MTSAHLWWVLLSAAILGTLLPLYAIVQKSANAKTTVDRVLGGSDSWSRRIEAPIFGGLVGLGERLGKNDWTWHNPRTRGHSRYYLRYALMNATLAVVLLVGRRRCRVLGRRVLAWMRNALMKATLPLALLLGRRRCRALGDRILAWKSYVVRTATLPLVLLLGRHRCRAFGHRILTWMHYALRNVKLALLLGQRRCRARCDRILAWMRRNDHPGPRRLIVGMGVFMILTYQLKIMSGVWFPGIAGWTYDNDSWRSTLATDRPDAPTDDPDDVATLGPAERWHLPSADEHAMLGATILDQNLRYLPQAGWLEGSAMVLHYADGSSRAANLDLVDLVFPQYIYGNPRRPDKRTDTAHFVRAIRRCLAERRDGKQMFLPLAVAYPVHCNYMPLPYETYPDPETLTAISFWELVVHVDPAGTFAIDHARRTNLIDAIEALAPESVDA